MFLSTFEKQLDAKRRIVVPQEFRAAAAPAAGGFDGVFCFPSIEADCLEGGGQALFQRYQALMEELPFGDAAALGAGVHRTGRHAPARLRHRGAHRAARKRLCEQFGLTDWVAVVGLGDRFQIWSRDAYPRPAGDTAPGRPRGAGGPARGPARP